MLVAAGNTDGLEYWAVFLCGTQAGMVEGIERSVNAMNPINLPG